MSKQFAINNSQFAIRNYSPTDESEGLNSAQIKFTDLNKLRGLKPPQLNNYSILFFQLRIANCELTIVWSYLSRYKCSALWLGVLLTMTTFTRVRGRLQRVLETKRTVYRKVGFFSRIFYSKK